MRLSDRQRRSLRLGLTPLIDVVFLLLLFFMLSSTFMDKRHLVINAAPRGIAASGESKSVVVRVGSEALFVGEHAVSPDGLASALRARAGDGGDRPILVRPDGDVPLQRVVDVIEVIGGAGFSNLSLQPAR